MTASQSCSLEAVSYMFPLLSGWPWTATSWNSLLQDSSEPPPLLLIQGFLWARKMVADTHLFIAETSMSSLSSPGRICYWILRSNMAFTSTVETENIGAVLFVLLHCHDACFPNTDIFTTFIILVLKTAWCLVTLPQTEVEVFTLSCLQLALWHNCDVGPERVYRRILALRICGA